MSIKEFWKPQFTTSEFEGAKTRDGQCPEITQIVPGNEPGHPTKVYGKVADQENKKINVSWNEYGECWTYYPNNRSRKWDLVHPESSQIASAQEYFVAMAIFIVMLAIAGLF